MNICHIYGTFKPYISGRNFPSSKNKKNPLIKSFLHFDKWNFLATSLKNFLYFRKKLEKEKKKVSYTLSYKEAKLS